MKPGFALCVACGLVAAVRLAEAGPLERPASDARSGFLFDSNLSNAAFAADRQSDFFWVAEAGARWAVRPARDWTLALRPSVGGAVPFRYQAFRELSLGAEATATFKAGLGPDAPRFEAGFAMGRKFFADEAMSRWEWSPVARYRQRWGDTFGWEAFYAFEARVASGEVFGGTANTWGALLTFDPVDRLTLVAGYRIRHGDVVSWAEPPQPELRRLSSADAPSPQSFGRDFVAYRIAALTQVLGVGVGYALTDDVTAEVVYEWRVTGRESIRYDGHIVQWGIKAAF